MKKINISFILNIIIVILVIFGCICMFSGFKFMKDVALLDVTGIGMLKFYTVDSNILIALCSIILAIYEYRLLKGKIKKIPISIYIIKYLGVCAIALTFITTLVFLAPSYGLYAMYNNSNLFFHLIIPILSFISFIFFENEEFKYHYAFIGVLPMFIYSIFYILMIMIHLNDGGLTFKYDFYGFLGGNIYNIFIVMPIIYGATYIISVLLLFFNKKTYVK